MQDATIYPRTPDTQSLQTSRRRFLSTLGAGALALTGCAANGARTVRGETMGTYFKVVLADDLDEVEFVDVSEAIRKELAQLTSRISAYDGDAELARLNAAKPNVWHNISEETAALIERSMQLTDTSDGAFDATVGPLVELWGFGTRQSNVARVPDAHAIDDAMALTRFSAFGFDRANARAARLHPEARLDVDGIGKGYGVDVTALMLDGLGLNNYLVEIGGELRTRGTRADGGSWQIGVAHPNGGAPVLQMSLSNKAIATSGDYLQFFDVDGHRYSHLVDPRTGYPIQGHLTSVSVVADDTLSADALSTALAIMGLDAGLAYATQHHVAAYFLYRDGDALKSSRSPLFVPV